MLTLSFEEFVHGEDLVDYGDGDFELYLVRNESKILYIGIAESGIYSRWFLCPGSHLTTNLYPVSPIGHEIVNNLPQSSKWKIDLWPIKDLLDFLEIEHIWNPEEEIYMIPRETDGLIRKRCRVTHLESFMINYLFPKINIIRRGRQGNEYFIEKYLKLVSQNP